MGSQDLVNEATATCIHCGKSFTLKFLFGLEREVARARIREACRRYHWTCRRNAEVICCDDCKLLEGITTKPRPPRIKKRRWKRRR